MTERKHSHYFKPIKGFKFIDVYRVCHLFNINDPSGAIQHAIKKLLVAGGRGAGKDITRDISEAVDTLNRYLEMRQEELEAAIENAASDESKLRIEQKVDLNKAFGTLGNPVLDHTASIPFRDGIADGEGCRGT